METARLSVPTFRGLNNVADPLQLGHSWFRRADNCLVTNKGKLVRAPGFAAVLGGMDIQGAYVTLDLQRMYLVDDGQLQQVNPDFSTSTLASGLADGPMYFVEVNGLVYFTNGTDYGVVQDGRVWPWGIETPGPAQLAVGSGVLKAGTYQVCCTFVDARGIESGSGDVEAIALAGDGAIAISSIPHAAGMTTNVYVTARDGKVYFLLAENAGNAVSYNCVPNALGDELRYFNVSGPRGTLPALWGGQIWIAEWFAGLDLTVVWGSLGMQYHHFDLGDNAFIVPGEVRTMTGIAEGLVIGTDRAIRLFNGTQLQLLAPYGVVPGWHDSVFNGNVYLWSLRGLCSAMPFTNLTDKTVSVAPGLSAGGLVMETGGMRRYVVSLQKGGDAFNRRPT